MKLRFFAAVVTGCLAQVLSMAAMWIWTKLDLLEVAVWSIFFYFVALMAVIWVTEPKKIKARRHTEPQIYDLKK